MREEYHGIWNNGSGPFKQLYGWGTINMNIWLPSLIELVGIDTNKFYEPYGCYCSAMQGLSISALYYTDAQGGAQFAYFNQYNASGGGEKIWSACNQEQSWLRSPAPWDAITAWRITNTQRFDTPPATASHAVLVGTNSVSFTMVIKGITIAHSLHCISSPQKGTQGSPVRL